MRIRAFEERDYEHVVAIGNATGLDHPVTVEEARPDDALWDGARFFRLSVVAEDTRGVVVGCGEVAHSPGWFHPDNYRLDVRVDPARQRHGIGTRLYLWLFEVLRRRAALVVRAEAMESAVEAVAFLTRRGFREVQPIWMARLDVSRFDFERFAGAEARVAEQGITLTSLGAELARSRPRLAPAVRAARSLSARRSFA